jgi:LCP family protein required for cell wall assembly
VHAVEGWSVQTRVTDVVSSEREHPDAAAGSSGDERPRWRKRLWRRHRWLVLTVAVVLVIAALAGGYALVLLSRITRLDVRLPGSAPGGTTYLIIGSDSRSVVPANEQAAFGNAPGARADVVLVLRVPDRGAPVLLSVPRDLLVLEKDLGLHRLTLTWLDGPQATVNALCTSLGLGVDHLVRLQFDGFRAMVDAVGGVDVTVPRPTRDLMLNWGLFTGTHHLDGADALTYVRARHLVQWDGTAWTPVPNERGEQERTVLREVAHRASLSLTNPLGTHHLLWAVTGALAVDHGTGLGDLHQLANAMRALKQANELDLPASTLDGPIPYAQISTGAYPLLHEVGAGGKACPHAAFAEARPA